MCYTVRPSLSVEVDCFHVWLEIHVPRCAVRGQYRLLHCLHDMNPGRDRHQLARLPPLFCFRVLTCHSFQLFEVSALMRKRRGHLRTLKMQDNIVVGLLKLNRNWICDDVTVAIVTGRSNLQSLRVLIESLLSMQGGGWTTTGTEIEKKKSR